MKKIYGNAKIYTVDERCPRAEAICVENGKITLVGSDADVRSQAGSDAEYIDLGGKTVLPGFIDSHAHVMEGAQELLFKVNLVEAESKEDCLKAVADFRKDHPDADFIQGSGWINTYFDSVGPRKEWLDEIAPDVPIVLNSGDHHSIWANSKAIEMTGITKDTEVEGGVIEKDPDTGEIAGTFRENAQNIFDAIKPIFTVEQCKEALVFLESIMGEVGLTMVHDPIVRLHSSELEAYKEMDREGRLNVKIRASLMTTPETIEDMRDEYVPEREACNKGEHFKAHSIKVLLDGVVEGATAYMKKPYAHKPGYHGEPIWTDDELKKHFKWALENGFQTHSHAIGDAAAAQMLTALEYAEAENGKPNIRPVGAHLQIVDRDDYDRLKNQQIIVSANPYWFVKEKGYFYGLEVPYLGEERALHEYPMKSLMDEAGLLISSGSDFPVTIPPAPLLGIQTGVTRCDYRSGEATEDDVLGPEERMTVEDMIKTFTINAAYADFAEDITGSITPGKFADFVVLGENIFEVPAEKISEIPIVMTVSEGKVIYNASIA